MLADQMRTKREIGLLPPQLDSLPSYSLRSRQMTSVGIPTDVPHPCRDTGELRSLAVLKGADGKNQPGKLRARTHSVRGSIS
jgi:hypothetical protein